MSRSYSQAKLAERRARAGGIAAATSPTRKYPLRKIVGETMERIEGTTVEVRRQVLECGHTIAVPSDMIGERYPARRRCRKCFREAGGDD
jgi:hypothetical protein